MTPRPETFEALIANIDEAAKQYQHIGDVRMERIMRIISKDISYCYARETSLWMERMYNLEVQRNKAIEALGKSITSDFEERLSVIEEKLAEEEDLAEKE